MSAGEQRRALCERLVALGPYALMALAHELGARLGASIWRTIDDALIAGDDDRIRTALESERVTAARYADEHGGRVKRGRS